jgi:hypothetical protein
MLATAARNPITNTGMGKQFENPSHIRDEFIVIDPAERLVWSFHNGATQETKIIAQRGELTIPSQSLWDEVDLQNSRLSGKA